MYRSYRSRKHCLLIRFFIRVLIPPVFVEQALNSQFSSFSEFLRNVRNEASVYSTHTSFWDLTSLPYTHSFFSPVSMSILLDWLTSQDNLTMCVGRPFGVQVLTIIPFPHLWNHRKHNYKKIPTPGSYNAEGWEPLRIPQDIW